MQSFLQAASAEYRGALPARVDGIERSWAAIVRGDAAGQPLAGLVRELHSIAGSAGTFGLAAVSEAARAAEGFLSPYAERGAAPDAARRPEFERLLLALGRSARS
jgi:HPt (histidine-containing phosphotransfer) domain-containing protein